MAQAETVSFEASEGRLYNAVLRSIAQLGYSIKHSDPNARMVSFNTGMSMRSWAGQDMTVSVVPATDAAFPTPAPLPGKSSLLIGGTRAQHGNPFGGGGGQITDWGEKGKVTRTLVAEIQKVLPTIPELPSATPASKAPQTSGPAVFEPDGVYAGFPYRVLDGDRIDAMMSGTLVRFKSMEQFIAAATGQTA
jgi:hypothetical protein